MKPLRIAWKHRVPLGGSETLHHLDNERAVIAWRGHGVVSYGATQDNELGAIFDRDGHLIRRIVELAGRRDRYPMGLVTTWPDEGIAMGFMQDRFEVVYVDLDGAPRVVAFDAVPHTSQRLVAMADGGLLVSTPGDLVDPGRVDWQESLDRDLWQRPFEDRVYVTDCIEPGRPRWRVPGRAACVADDVIVFEEGAGSEKSIVARGAADGSELWRQPALDRFVLGTMPVPAWSEDRIYLYDRGERRRAVWNRQPPPPARVTCASSRTGAAQWTVDVDGDVVSFLAQPTWVAWVVVRGPDAVLHVHRHDGARVCEVALVSAEAPEQKWPPAFGWPCVVHGDEEHVLVVQRTADREGGQLSAIRTEHGDFAWHSPLASYLPTSPAVRTQRLLNQAPIAFADGVAYFRSGAQLFGLRG
jgi:hypothetical protein